MPFEELYEKYGRYLENFCTMKMSDRDMGFDIAHESFLKYYNHVKKYPNQIIDNPKAFLFRIASNIMNDSYRRNGNIIVDSLDAIREQSGDTFEPQFDEIQRENSAINFEILMKREKCLTKYQKEILLHYYNGRTISEIAEIYGITYNAVSAHLTRMRIELKRQFRKEEYVCN